MTLKNIYKGHRYVPLIMGVWDVTKEYEGLSIVQWEGNSFTSKKEVPVGTLLSNETYWASTGNYNAQIEFYRRDVKTVKDDLDNLEINYTENVLATQAELLAINESIEDIEENNLTTIDTITENEIATTAKFEKISETFTQKELNIKTLGAVGDGVTNDTSIIQLSLDYCKSSGGGKVFIPEGVYFINKTLIIYENTELTLAKTARILRSNDMYAMIMNGAENAGLYTGESNIIIRGGTWDANGKNFPTKVTALAFGHCKNILITDLRVTDVYDWHHVELNAVQNGHIINCHFDGMTLARETSEMIQIDLMSASGQFPWFGPYDSTPCKDIIIEKCLFENGDCAGIGSHTSAEGKIHDNITIRDNIFRNLSKNGIVGLNYSNVLVENNVFDYCLKGVVFVAGSKITCKNIKIKNNTFTDINRSNESRAIQLIATTTAFIKDCIISDNRIDTVGLDGITVDYCDNISILNNVIENCQRNGVWSYFSNYTTISTNKFSSNNLGNSSNDNADIRVNGLNATVDATNIMILNNRMHNAHIIDPKNSMITNNVTAVMSIVSPTNTQVINNFINNVWVANL